MESRTQGSRPRTQTKSEAKDRNARGLGQGHKRKCSPKKKVFKNFFSGYLKKKKKKQKGLHTNFSGGLQKKAKRSSQKFFRRSPENKSSKKFFRHSKNFNNSKNSAVLESRIGQFSRTWGFKAKDLTFETKVKDFKMCPRGQGRPRRLHLWDLKSSYFCKKMQNFWALETPPPEPQNSPPPLRISGYANVCFRAKIASTSSSSLNAYHVRPCRLPTWLILGFDSEIVYSDDSHTLCRGMPFAYGCHGLVVIMDVDTCL